MTTARERTPLDRLLFERRLTRTAVARALGLSVASVSRWATGERPIPPDHRRQLAALLDVPEEAL